MFNESRLTEQTKNFLADELDGTIKKNLKNKIELFDKYLCLSKAETDYNNLNDRIAKALDEFANGASPKEVLKPLSITEQYLKSLVYLLDKQEYYRIKDTSQAFKETIISLGIIKPDNNRNLNLNLKNLEEGEKFKNDYDRYHWSVAYTFRNDEAHTAKKYKHSDAIKYIYSILYVLIESAWKYRSEIESKYTDDLIFDGINKNGYFKQIIKEYESKNLQKTFVVMSIVNEDYKSSWSDDDEEDEARTNLISSLDIMKVAEKNNRYIKLVGEAGLGKSRLMRYLHYLDAKEGKTFPVYIELKELSNLKLSITELITEKSGLNEEACDLLMQNGGMSLYLDGINEILCSDRDKRIFCSQINELADKYPKTKILISDRENSYITVKGIPTYLLVKLDEPLVHVFISKNCKSKETEDMVRKILEEEKYLYDIVRTPFMLEAFISLVENNEYTTSIKNESKLRAKFVESLIRRESEEKLEGRASKIKLLLTYLFIKNGNLDDSIGSFSENQILSRFSKCMEYYRFDCDTVEILELIVQMGVLVKNEERYSFANDIYESHFKDQALEVILELDE